MSIKSFFVGVQLLLFVFAHGQSGLNKIEDFGPNPGSLNLWYYAPAGVSDACPLLVVLHGCSQRANRFAAESGWNELADRYGFIVLYPEQRFQNNASGCFNWYGEEEPCDLPDGKSVLSMIDYMQQNFGTGKSSTYLYGVSAGAALAIRMLVCQPERFQSGACLAGGPFAKVRNLTEAGDMMRNPQESELPEIDKVMSTTGHWPKLIVYHGTKDRVVDPLNSEQLVNQWRKLLDLTERPDETREITAGKHSFCRKTYRSGEQERIIWYTGHEQGHYLPIDPGGEAGQGGAKGVFVKDCDFFLNAYIARDFGLILGE